MDVDTKLRIVLGYKLRIKGPLHLLVLSFTCQTEDSFTRVRLYHITVSSWIYNVVFIFNNIETTTGRYRYLLTKGTPTIHEGRRGRE